MKFKWSKLILVGVAASFSSLPLVACGNTEIKCKIVDMQGQPLDNINVEWTKNNENEIVGMFTVPDTKIFNSVQVYINGQGEQNKTNDFVFHKNQLILPPTLNLKSKDTVYVNVKFDDRVDLDIDKFTLGYDETYGLWEITGYIGSYEGKNTVYIPSEIDGKPIKRLITNDFVSNTNIKYVIADEGLEWIGPNSFLYTSIQGDLNLPSSLTLIGDSAFTCLKQEQSCFTGGLALPEGNDNVGLTICNGAFNSCPFTGRLHFPNRTELIGANSFEKCDKFFGDLYLPNNIKEVQASAFKDCTGFDGKIHLSENSDYKIIAENSFLNCSNLKGELVIPSNVEEIKYGAFKNCKNITKLIFKSTKLETVYPIQGTDPTQVGAFPGMTGLRQIDFSAYGSTIPSWIRKCVLDGYTFFDTKIPIGERGFIFLSGMSRDKLLEWVDILGKIGLENVSTDPTKADWVVVW